MSEAKPRHFKRGDGPLVSVLLPTRKRPSWLVQSVDSLHSLAKDQMQIEYIFKIDDDDQETVQLVNQMRKLLPPNGVKVIVSPRGEGFYDMHNWVNQMSKMATGDWQLLWNDDAIMKTEHWDAQLACLDADRQWHDLDEICLCIAPTVGRVGANEFVFVRKEVPRILGHWSLSPHNDNWIHSVMHVCGSAWTVAINVMHMSHVIGDLTRQESEAAYKRCGEEFNSLESYQARLDDAQKILNYIKGKRDV